MENKPNQINEMSNFPQKEDPWAKQEIDDTTKNIAEISSSIRILEDRYLNLRKKSQITDQHLIDLQKEYFKEKKHINQDLTEIKIKLQDLIIELNIIRGELKDIVKEKDIKVINTYLDFWEPIQFVTRTEVEKLIKKQE